MMFFESHPFAVRHHALDVSHSLNGAEQAAL